MGSFGSWVKKHDYCWMKLHKTFGFLLRVEIHQVGEKRRKRWTIKFLEHFIINLESLNKYRKTSHYQTRKTSEHFGVCHYIKVFIFLILQPPSLTHPYFTFSSLKKNVFKISLKLIFWQNSRPLSILLHKILFQVSLKIVEFNFVISY